MVVQRPSRQELIRRQRRSGFVGRHGELSIFRDVLRQPPEETTQFLFHVRGPGGVGKSTLLRQMEGAAREAQAITAYVDESVTGALEVMESISGQLAQQGMTLKNFDKRLSTYRQRRHEADATAAVAVQPGGGTSDSPSQGATGPNPSPSSVVASQLGLVGLGMIPGVGAFVGAVDPQQVAAGASHLKTILSSRFSNHDDVKLVLSPLQELTPIFLEDLTEIAQRRTWLVLYFDTFERTGPLLNSWLRDLLLSDKYGELPANVLVVLAGQSGLNDGCWGDFRDLITDVPLDVFTEAEARLLLTAKGITHEPVIEVILQLSQRLPVLVSTLAESRPTSVAEVGDPSDTAVERFLKWETDPARRAVALACALAQELDEDVYRAAVDDEAAELFGWLKSMPFVNYRAGRCRYHDVVRAAMLSLQRRQSPSRWHEQQTRLAESFNQRRVQLEQNHPAQSKDWWEDEIWRNFRMQETYHRLCADSRTAFPEALRLLVDAYRYDINTARRWVQTIVQAGQDSAVPTVSNWGHQFLDALEGEPPTRTHSLSLLLVRTDLDNETRSIVHTLRGRYLKKSKNYDQALTEYSTALTLNPTAHAAYCGRGQVHHLMGRLDDAVSDYSQAIELDPASTLSIYSRGFAYLAKRQVDDALADYDRVIELDPVNFPAHNGRGMAYHTMGRFDDALIEYDRAIELRSEDAWTYSCRADTYNSLQKSDKALADYTRAIEIDSNSIDALVGRGMIYTTMEQFDDALSDFNRAVDVSPDHAWAYTCRGLAYGALGQADEALADYNRAVELDPNNASSITSRGLAYQLERRFDDALADYDRAIELAPDNSWAHANRGLIYHSMKRFNEALTDFSRAVDLSPEDTWAYANRGDTLHSMERYDEALADYSRAIELESNNARLFVRRGVTYFNKNLPVDAIADYDRAIEIDPENAHALTCRGLTYGAEGRHDDALADHNRAIELDPNSAWALTSRASALDSIGRHDDALADHNRAIELDPNSAWALSSRASTYRSTGRYEDALADYNRAVAIEPEGASNLTGRGLTYRLIGRYDDALADFNRAIDLDSNRSWSHTNRGLVYRLIGRYDESLADLDRAVELEPRSGWAHYERSVVLHALLHKDRKKQIIRAMRILSSDAGTPSTKGNMFLSAILMMRWQKAEESYSDFIASNPALGQMKELLMAIDSLAVAVPARGVRLRSFRQKLENSLSLAG
ncbi:tetratricopeptide repeat protein [Streptomyces bicolor]|uniref:tetratricopeptide repeat protein n=1 Tax=Streptomyces bicolor TaxID=66874 RepID=UPI00131B2E05|nr:tetratricopeptide repeat protein [Streptomyces bicolor]